VAGPVPGGVGGRGRFQPPEDLRSRIAAPVDGEPLFASFAIVVGLLIWLNLIARLTLISAAWAANDVDKTRGGELPAHARAQTQEQAHSQLVETVGSPRPKVVGGPQMPTIGARSLDRTTLGSGFILGAAAMAATGALARGIRSMVRLGRG
jgi:membrane protein